jgi:hypothetical protein
MLVKSIFLKRLGKSILINKVYSQSKSKAQLLHFIQY